LCIASLLLFCLLLLHCDSSSFLFSILFVNCLCRTIPRPSSADDVGPARWLFLKCEAQFSEVTEKGFWCEVIYLLKLQIKSLNLYIVV
jgi:hypothetical protein